MSASGYRGVAKKFINSVQADTGDILAIRTVKGTFEGSLMPRYEYSDDEHVVLKLENGYNVGILVSNITDAEKKSAGPKSGPEKTSPPKMNPELPSVLIISTGGTIASKVDYRTGAVRPALTAEDLYSAVPELSDIAQVHSEVLYSILSENMTPLHWKSIAEKVGEEVKKGYSGIVITHGTDTMAYTAAALSFALTNVPIPIMMVGSQRSSDRPSSDSAMNLVGAVKVAASADFSGIYVIMHRGMGDDELVLHRGTRVRKNHTSRRDAFESIDASPVAYLSDGKIVKVFEGLPSRRNDDDCKVKANFDERVALLKFHPGMDSALVDYLTDHGWRGIVLEGTGLGHLAQGMVPSVKKAVDRGLIVAITSQCIWGRVKLTVYETGRDLLKAGAIPLDNMLSETALAKVMWAVANYSSDEAKEVLLENIAGEIVVRSPTERRPSR